METNSGSSPVPSQPDASGTNANSDSDMDILPPHEKSDARDEDDVSDLPLPPAPDMLSGDTDNRITALPQQQYNHPDTSDDDDLTSSPAPNIPDTPKEVDIPDHAQLSDESGASDETSSSSEVSKSGLPKVPDNRRDNGISDECGEKDTPRQSAIATEARTSVGDIHTSCEIDTSSVNLHQMTEGTGENSPPAKPLNGGALENFEIDEMPLAVEIAGTMPHDNKPETVAKRDRWSRKIEFLLSLIGFSVGLGNVWRFPYLCHKHGGGAFLIPYIIATICGGIPLFFLEIVLGQMMSRGAIESWNIIPICKGIGVSQILIIFFLMCYYNVILCWALYYLFASFTSTLPWSHCNNDWNTAQCISVTSSGNSTPANMSMSTVMPLTNLTTTLPATNKTLDSAIEFWENKVLDISDSIENMGPVKWDLCLCLLLAWIIVFFCVARGIKSSGKAVYFTATSPYVFLLILFIRAATLSGSDIGLKFYMVPDAKKLGEVQVWVDAATQVIFSMSICIGTLPALASYNDFYHNALRDCLLFSGVNIFTTIFSGFIIFMTLGHMSLTSGISIEDLPISGPGLAFVAYPKALTTLPLSPFWSILFFITLLLLGLDSEFVSVEGFVTGITDIFPRQMAKKWRREIFTLVTCVVCFLIGLSMVTKGGVYVVTLFDHFSVSRFVLLVAGLQCIAIAYIYGINKFLANIQTMFWFPEPVVWIFKILWAGVTPVYMLIIFIMSLAVYEGLKYERASANEKYFFPPYAVGLGWMIQISSLILVPIVTAYKIYQASGSIMNRIRYLVKPQYSEDTPLDPLYGEDPEIVFEDQDSASFNTPNGLEEDQTVISGADQDDIDASYTGVINKGFIESS